MKYSYNPHGEVYTPYDTEKPPRPADNAAKVVLTLLGLALLFALIASMWIPKYP